MLKGIITSVKQATAKTGSPYCTLTIRTQSGDSNVNVWGTTSDKFELWKLITISQEKVNDQGTSCSLANCKIEEATNEFRTLVPTPPSVAEWDCLTDELVDLMIAYGCSDQKIKFYKSNAERLYAPYSKMPAAKSNHHVFPGGLLAHTYQVLNLYRAMYPALPYKTNPFIVSIACLFHDYLKLAEYDPKTYDYQPVMFLKGHVVGSAEVLGELMRREGFDSTLILHCQHCILSHHGRMEWGSPVLPATPEAFTVHHCDMLSGHGVMFGETPSNTKSFGLGTTVFHYE